MFTHINLAHEYTLEAMPGTEVTQNMKLGYSGDEVGFTDIAISQTAESSESVVVYTTGLVVYAKVAPKKTVIRTNGIFKPGDDGDLHLVGLDPDNKTESR